MTTRAPPGAQSVLRAIAVLKAFTLERPERQLAELSRETGLSRGTTHRLLAALASEGLVVKSDSSGRYRLGPLAVSLGARALRASELRELARSVLERLAQDSGETATLEVLSQGKMLILDEVLGAHLIGAAPSLGTSWAIHATSTGKALLSELSPTRRQALLHAPLARYTKRTVTHLDELERELDAVRKRGYAIAVEELEEGYAAVGAVIRVPLGEPHGTISLGGPSSRFTPDRLERYGELVASGAKEIARRLGAEAE